MEKLFSSTRRPLSHFLPVSIVLCVAPQQTVLDLNIIDPLRNHSHSLNFIEEVLERERSPGEISCRIDWTRAPAHAETDVVFETFEVQETN